MSDKTKETILAGTITVLGILSLIWTAAVLGTGDILDKLITTIFCARAYLITVLIYPFLCTGKQWSGSEAAKAAIETGAMTAIGMGLGFYAEILMGITTAAPDTGYGILISAFALGAIWGFIALALKIAIAAIYKRYNYKRMIKKWEEKNSEYDE